MLPSHGEKLRATSIFIQQYLQSTQFIRRLRQNKTNFNYQLHMQTDNENPIWAKLIPLGKGLNTYPLRNKEILIGRSNCNIVISQKRLSGKHCLIQQEGAKSYITDFSTNGTYLNTDKIGKNNRLQLKDGDEVWLLPISRVTQDQTIGFKFSLIVKQVPNHKESQNQKLISSIKEQMICPFCFNIMIFPVTVQPCNHRFCGPCLTTLVNNKKGQCITCRKQLITAVRDAAFNAIITDYLKSHPQEKVKDQDEDPNIFGYEPTDIRAIIHENYQQKGKQTKPVQNPNNGGKKQEPMDIQRPRRRVNLESEAIFAASIERAQNKKQKSEEKTKPKRRTKKKGAFINSDISASTDSEKQQQTREAEGLCKECIQERNGFKCKKNQIHVNCHNCTKPFARRDEEKLCQKCILCGSFFCNLYLPPCQKNGAKLIQLGKRGPTCVVDLICFRNNRVQMDSFKNMLIAMKKTLGDMFKEMLQLTELGRFQFMYDKRLLRGDTQIVQRRVPMNKRSPICDNCWRQLWFQMIFVYMRQNIDMVSEAIRKRPACYWGVNCNTMGHNLQHAKRYNHMLEQTRF